MTTRVPLTPERRQQLHDFAYGLGATYDAAIEFLLREVCRVNESPMAAGDRLRPKFQPNVARRKEGGR